MRRMEELREIKDVRGENKRRQIKEKRIKREYEKGVCVQER